MSPAPARSRKTGEADMLAAITERQDIRLFLLYGQDPSMIEDIARKMGARLGEAERVDIDGGELRSDPARLADEAASLSLFGTNKYIRLRMQRDEGLAAIENLIEAAQAGNPVIATTGNLTPANKLRKLATGSSAVMALACYSPNEAQASALILEMARAHGLDMDRAIARRIAEITTSDRTLGAIEVEKIALYLDAAPDRPQVVSADILAALGAETLEENIGGLLGRVMAGDLKAIGAGLQHARQLGLNEIRVIRALQRRVAQLIALRGEVDGGAAIGQLVDRTRSIFFKEQDEYKRALSLWNSKGLERLNARLLDLEVSVMAAGGGLANTLLEHELLAVARNAARGRR